jgi:hypothetical protein
MLPEHATVNEPSGPVSILFALVGLVAWLAPIWLGLRAAKAKGRSPRWMWLGLHPLSGWAAFVWLRYFARPVARGADQPATEVAPGSGGELNALRSETRPGVTAAEISSSRMTPPQGVAVPPSSPTRTAPEWATLLSRLPIDHKTDGGGDTTTTRYASAEAVAGRLAELDATKGRDWRISVGETSVEVRRIVGVGEIWITFFRTAKNRWQEHHHHQSD